MKILAWIKSLSWIAIAGAAAGAIYMVFNAVRASQLEDRADRGNKVAENMIQDHTKKSLNRANKLRQGVAKDKQAARDRRAKAEAQLESLSEDRTMDEIAGAFNSRKLRDAAG